MNLLYNFRVFFSRFLSFIFYLLFFYSCAYELSPDIHSLQCAEEKSLNDYVNSSYLELLDKSDVTFLILQEEVQKNELKSCQIFTRDREDDDLIDNGKGFCKWSNISEDQKFISLTFYSKVNYVEKVPVYLLRRKTFPCIKTLTSGGFLLTPKQ